MLRHPHLLALPFLLLGCPGSPRKDAADTADTAPSTETANDDTAKECARQDWYADADGDGHGAGDAESACDAPAGTVSVGDDCDDTDPAVYPGAPHECHYGLDLDCDGVVSTECDPGEDADRTIRVDDSSPIGVRGDVDGDGLDDLLMTCGSCGGDGITTFPGALYIVLGRDILAGADETVGASVALTTEARAFGGTPSWLPDFDGDGMDDLVVSGTDGKTYGDRSRIQVVTSTEVEDGHFSDTPDWGIQREDSWGTAQGLWGGNPGLAASMGSWMAVYHPGDLPLGDGVEEWTEDVGTDAVVTAPEGTTLTPMAWLPAAAYPDAGLLVVAIDNSSRFEDVCLFDPGIITGPLAGGAELAEACAGDFRGAPWGLFPAGDLDGDGEADVIGRFGSFDDDAVFGAYRVCDILAGVDAPLFRGVSEGDLRFASADGVSDLNGSGRSDLVGYFYDGEGYSQPGAGLFAGEDLPWGGTLRPADASVRWYPPENAGSGGYLAGGDIDGDGQGDLVLSNFRERGADAYSVIFGW